MSKRNTFSRSLHDVGLAAWFGGSLMGAVGLNGATAQAKSSQETLRLSSIGWARWTPVAIAAIGAHAVGGVGLIAGNTDRLQRQDEAKTNTIIKLVLTVAAAAVTAYSGILGKKVYDHQDEPTQGATDPAQGVSCATASGRSPLSRVQPLCWVPSKGNSNAPLSRPKGSSHPTCPDPAPTPPRPRRWWAGGVGHSGRAAFCCR